MHNLYTLYSMYEVSMNKKASDMQVKILNNRIEKLDSAEIRIMRKLNLAQKRVSQIQKVRKSKYDDNEFFKNNKEQVRLLLEKKREQVSSMRKNLRDNIIITKNK